MARKNLSYRCIVMSFTFQFLFMTLLNPVWSGIKTIQDDCKKEIEEAKIKYTETKFDEVITMLNKCLNKSGLPNEQLVTAHSFLAKAYEAKSLEDEAKAAIEKLLRLFPNYKADPVNDKPAYVDMVEEVRIEMKKKMDGGINWLLIAGGGAVAGIVAVVVLAGKKRDNGQLPSPPPIPPIP